VVQVSSSLLKSKCVPTPIPPAPHREEERRMTGPGSPTVRRRRLAAELREIRESKGKSGDAVAAALKWSPSKISRYERARTGLQPREVERLLDYYEITGARRTLLLALAEDAAQKGWWEEFADALSADYQQFIGLEHEASSIAIWHVDVVPGLLQTQAYARHIIGSYSRIEPIAPGMIERLVKVRTRRQQRLNREPGLQLSGPDPLPRPAGHPQADRDPHRAGAAAAVRAGDLPGPGRPGWRRWPGWPRQHAEFVQFLPVKFPK
jgi:transcriptional regulator with XRE-family HTH domain